MRSDTIDAQLRRPGLSDTFLEFQQIFESIPEDIVERVGRLLAPVSLDALSIVQAPCSAIVDAYMSLLNNSDNRDSVPWIFLLLYFRNQFRNTNPRSREIDHRLRERRTASGKPLSSPW